MSGHSKWANIKNRKGAQDKKRSEAFTKVSKNIITAVKQGGGNTNIESNSYLKTAVDKAREVNMPKENIERLLARFEERKNNLATYMFEGFGPFGVPVMVEAETDNKNRILTEVSLVFRNYGGNLGGEGAVAYMFDRIGEVEVEELSENPELELIDKGAIDFDGNSILTEAKDLNQMTISAGEMGLKVVSSRIVMRPKSPISITSEEEAGKLVDMMQELEENDDVTGVFAGFEYHE